MNLKTYRGRSMADALAQVKQDLGKDAVILHTRATRVGAVMGMGGHDEFEITASDAATVMGPKIRNAPPSATLPREAAAAVAANRPFASANEPARETRASRISDNVSRVGENGDDGFITSTFTTIGPGRAATIAAPLPQPTSVVEFKPAAPAASATMQGVSLSATAAGVAPASIKPQSTPANAATTRPAMQPPREKLATAVELAPTDAGAVDVLRSELGSIRSLMSQLLSETRRTGISVGNASALATTGMTPPLATVYLQLQDTGLRADLIERVIGSVRDELHADELADITIVRSAIERHTATLMPCVGTISKPGKRASSYGPRPLTIALVGPTGVGKTTTIAKLAAAYKLRHNVRVGLITSDTYRIAAVEQLRTYANIIDLPLKVCLTPREVGEACTSLSDCDVVLLDTAGRSQHDTARIDELSAFIDAANADETHLVLSAIMAEDVLTSAAQRFSVLRPTNLILTKLDEAVRFGIVPTVCVNVGLKLSFLTTGQEVPEHIELAHPPRLARLVLDGKLRP
ncbi:flagellar biosynthesis protein FlhF [Phycisphaerae bacterium]|nr:flagellar biosynthesis protein FlhF [Phycisphaerae bacterium]